MNKPHVTVYGNGYIGFHCIVRWIDHKDDPDPKAHTMTEIHMDSEVAELMAQDILSKIDDARIEDEMAFEAETKGARK